MRRYTLFLSICFLAAISLAMYSSFGVCTGSVSAYASVYLSSQYAQAYSNVGADSGVTYGGEYDCVAQADNRDEAAGSYASGSFFADAWDPCSGSGCGDLEPWAWCWISGTDSSSCYLWDSDSAP